MAIGEREADDWPTADYVTMGGQRPALYYFHALDRFQRSRPFLRSAEPPGYWVFTDHHAIADGLRNSGLFSTRVVMAPSRDPVRRRIPSMLDAPEHTQWRRLLRPCFSRSSVERLAESERRFAREIIRRFLHQGSCDFYDDFADVFAATSLMHIMGLPLSRLDDLLGWERQILRGTEASDPTESVAAAAMQEAAAYFREFISQQRERPDRHGGGVVGQATGWQIDGTPVPDDDLLSCLLTLFLSGVETVAAQLSYAFLHLATHDADRQRIVAEPGIIPRAVEEMLRVYPTLQTGRRAVRDTQFHGCPVKSGDMVVFPLGMAGRDDHFYAEAKTVDLNRAAVNHITFGIGPHHCVGMHLARQELVIAMQEWHRLIPAYRIAAPGGIVEHASSVYSLENLPLTWDS